jgi:hypothetical protein
MISDTIIQFTISYTTFLEILLIYIILTDILHERAKIHVLKYATRYSLKKYSTISRHTYAPLSRERVLLERETESDRNHAGAPT